MILVLPQPLTRTVVDSEMEVSVYSYGACLVGSQGEGSRTGREVPVMQRQAKWTPVNAAESSGARTSLFQHGVKGSGPHTLTELALGASCL